MDNKSLIQIADHTAGIIKKIIESDGQIDQDTELALMESEKTLANKIDAYKHVIEDLEAEANKWEKRADQALAISTACRRYKENLKKSVKIAMERMDVTEMSGSEFKFMLQKNPPAVEIIDQTQVPESYKKTKIEISVDRRKVLNDLKAGVPVAGTKLTQDTHVVVKGVSK